MRVKSIPLSLSRNFFWEFKKKSFYYLFSIKIDLVDVVEEIGGFRCSLEIKIEYKDIKEGKNESEKWKKERNEK